MLCERFAERSGLIVATRIAPELPPISAEAELVTYRVAQEALTNIARHAGSDHAELTLGGEPSRLTLRVRDHGRGLGDGYVEGTGMRGMRERAGLIGARLEIANNPVGTGCVVRLDVPLEARA